MTAEPGLTDSPDYTAAYLDVLGLPAMEQLEVISKRRDDLTELLARLVDDARPGYTWKQIGLSLGTSLQAAQQFNARSRRRR